MRSKSHGGAEPPCNGRLAVPVFMFKYPFLYQRHIYFMDFRLNRVSPEGLTPVTKGGPAAYGLAEVGEALKQGRANHLLLSNSFAIPKMICKKCHFHGEGETCPTCVGQMQALSLEELYQQAERTGAEGSAGRG